MGDTENDEQPVERALKFTGPDTVEGLAIPFNSYDTDSETFTKDTDLCLDWFGKSGRPVLYAHGVLGGPGTAVVGRQTEYEEREDGIWAKSQLDLNRRYRKYIDKLIEEGALGYSTGAMQHLAKKNARQEITRWPWVELSLTPIPAHPATLVHYVKSSDALAHLAEVDYDIPDPLKAALTALDEWAALKSNDRDAFPDPGTLDEKAGRVSAALAEFREHAHQAADMRVKSGRVLSGANRDRIAKALASKAAVLEAYADLEALLAETDAPTAGKSDLWAEGIQAERAAARLLGVTFDLGDPIQ